MHDVQLEYLRHGEAHNQLLSPLTEYMVLCGTHPATTVRVPYEHRQFLQCLRYLRYGSKDSQERAARIEEMTALVTSVLSGAGGLRTEAQAAAECDDHGRPSADVPFLHLRLVITPKELSMLPFGPLTLGATTGGTLMLLPLKAVEPGT